jgi:hypothetical protein
MHNNLLVSSCLNTFAAFLLLCGRSAAPVQAAETPKYETGFATISKLSHDVCSMMDPKVRRTINPQPILLDKMAQPYFQPVEYFDGTNLFRMVVMSDGAVQLLNGFAHARALNNVAPGFLAQYLTVISGQEEITPLLCAQANDPRQLAPLGGTNEKLWNFDTMNCQITQFNQIAGALVAINLAHHYLGHYKKYSSQLIDAQNHIVPISTLVSAGEWRDALRKGAYNAMQCGLALDGLKAFMDGLGQMPTRPAWTLNFLPKDANISRIRKDLDNIQGAFFLSEK